MTDVFSNAAATLFADPNLSVSATVWPGAASVVDGWSAVDQDELEAGATGDAISVRATISLADDITNVSGQGVVGKIPMADIRVSDAPDLAAGDVVQVGTAYYVVIEPPMKEAMALIWTAMLRLGFQG